MSKLLLIVMGIDSGGETSCASSTLMVDKAYYLYGSLSAMNAYFYTNASSTESFEFIESQAGYNATIVCGYNSTCCIKCYHNACNDLTLIQCDQTNDLNCTIIMNCNDTCFIECQSTHACINLILNFINCTTGNILFIVMKYIQI